MATRPLSFWATIVFVFFLSCKGKTSFVLKLALLQDPRFPQLSHLDVQEILAAAQEMTAQKFATEIDFSLAHEGFVEDFFKSSSLPKNGDFIIDEEYLLQEFRKKKNSALAFLRKNWSLKDLGAYFPTGSYESFWQNLFLTYRQKLATLRNYRLKNGMLLLNHKPYESYRSWKKIMREQNLYDFILTNHFILYDEVAEPYPHVIFKHAKVSGSSFDSPKREGPFMGKSAMMSVFELYAEEEYFLGERTKKIKNYSRSFRNKALGGYLLAHEIGHMLFWISDVYDHGRNCLMDTRFENLEIADGYRVLLEHPEPCPRCLEYVEARKKIANLYEKQEIEKILDALKDYPKPNELPFETIRQLLGKKYSP
ncbi:MAG: hypothetical protein RML34_00850 [Leptospiraceae bacterium]|nr:hypothetical protein [Leptospiraceae bacterium]